MRKETLYKGGEIISHIDTLREVEARASGKWVQKGPAETFGENLKRIEFLISQCGIPTHEISKFKEAVMNWAAETAKREIERLTTEFNEL
jgi:predicted ATP-grasp superfamily ATP-dependent carboligase